MKKYKMSVDKLGKKMFIKIWGMYETDDVNSFIKDFKKLVVTIKPFEFVLDFDAEGLKVSKPEMLPMLEGCFKMYKDYGFKKVSVKVGNNITLKMQLTRVSKSVGLIIEAY